MWFNIIPAFAIVTAGMAAPGYALWYIHYLVIGNNYRRTLLERWDRHLYQRDVRLTGNVYKVAGLECINENEPDATKKRRDLRECPKK